MGKEMRKYVIVGTGGTGGAIGAHLANAGMDVTCLVAKAGVCKTLTTETP